MENERLYLISFKVRLDPKTILDSYPKFKELLREIAEKDLMIKNIAIARIESIEELRKYALS